jgi:hypothetical protein
VTPAPHPARKPVVAAKLAPAKPGTLNLKLRQWADVQIDGVAQGRKQISARFELTPGKHSLVAANPKYGERQIEITIKPEQSTPIEIDFSR